MNKYQTIKKQAEEILEYGKKAGYEPNGDVFCTLSYYINGIMDVGGLLVGENEALDCVITTHEQMFDLLKRGAPFEQALLYAEAQYVFICQKAGVQP